MSGTENYTLEDATRALTAKKRNFTRQYNSAGKITAYATANPSADSVAEVRAVQDRLKKAYGELMDMSDQLIEMDFAQDDIYEAVKDNTQSKYEDMVERIIATLHAALTPAPYAAPAAAAGGGGGGNAVNGKLLDALKPVILTKDFNPVEFKAWVK